MSELIFPEESYLIMGACFRVYNEMGCGFLEPVYQECLEMELRLQCVPFVAQPELALTYRGQMLQRRFRPDFLCFNEINLELKAVSRLASEHRSQVLNYLSASGKRLGMLVNFGHYPKLESERIICLKRQ